MTLPLNRTSSTNTTQEVQPITAPTGVSNPGSIFSVLTGGNALMLFFAVGGFIALNVLGGKKKGKLARSFLGGTKEKKTAFRTAKTQMERRTHNEVTLYVGTPKQNEKGNVRAGSKSLWIPNAQRGIAVVGAPGSGKTYSMINPSLRASLDQGFPTVVFDFKYPDQTERLVAYAAKRGYKVKVFAPGFPESEVCNVLDFLRDQDDATMARSIAAVMNKNFALNANAAEDKFFTDAGDQLSQAIFMLAKGLPDPDLMTASAILSLSNLPARIRAANERETPLDGWHMSNWVYLAFSQLLQLEDSEKTIAGVIGTASKIFSRFLSPELVSAFCGKTTLPLDLEGKQLLILGMDRQRREAIAPLLATVLHLIVTRNVTRKRKDPLVLGIDELPTLYLPYLTNWLNENRSDGLVTIIGFQNLNQLDKTYSREISRAILGGCATKAIFNPQEGESARAFSDYIGEEEILIRSKSRSTGKSSSSSTSDQWQKRHLVEAAQFNRFLPGRCVFINPSYADEKKGEGSIPLILNIQIPEADRKEEEWSASLWDKVRQRLIKNSGQVPYTDERSREEINRRIQLAKKYFPVDEKEKPKKKGEIQPQKYPPNVLDDLKNAF